MVSANLCVRAPCAPRRTEPTKHCTNVVGGRCGTALFVEIICVDALLLTSLILQVHVHSGLLKCKCMVACCSLNHHFRSYPALSNTVHILLVCRRRHPPP
jgi:hypothetical protein